MTTAASLTEADWHVILDDGARGPVPHLVMLSLVQQGTIEPATIVWQEGTEDWIRADASRLMPQAAGSANGRASLLRARNPAALVEGFRQMLARHGAHEPTLRALESMVRAGREPARAAQTLQAVLGRGRDLQRMLKVWRDLIAVTDDHDQRQALRLHVARVCEQGLGRADLAFEAYAEAFAFEPADLQARAGFERLARATEALPRFVELVRRRLEDLRGAPPAADLHRLLARICEIDLDHPEDALAHLRAATADGGPDAEAAEAFERLYTRLGRHRELLPLLRAQIDAAEGAARIHLLLRLGALCQDRLADPAGALTAWRAVLALAPGHEEALRRLERACADGPAPAPAADVLEQALRATGDLERLRRFWLQRVEALGPGPARAAALRRLGDLCDELGDPQAAFDWLARAFGEAPGDADLRAAFVGRAEADGRIPQAVERLVERAEQGDAGALADALDLAGRHPVGGATAERLYRAALAHDPQDTRALDGLAGVLEARRRWPDLAELLERRLAREPVRQGHERLAALYRDRLDRPDAALRHLRAVLTLAPDDEATAEAIRDLTAADPAARAEIDGHLLARLPEAHPRRLALHLELADLCEGPLARPRDAVRHLLAAAALDGADAVERWQRALALDPACLPASESLERTFAAEGRWSEALAVLQARVAAVGPADRPALQRRIAELQATHLGDGRAAIEALAEALRAAPADAAGLAELHRLCTAEARWDVLAQAYEAHVTAAWPAIEARHRLAELYAERLDDPYRAIDALVPIVEVVPDHAESLARLADLYTRAGSWAFAADMLEREAAVLPEPAPRVERLLRAAELREQALADLAGALAAVAAAFPIAPDHPGLRAHLLRLAEMADDFEPAARAYEAALGEGTAADPRALRHALVDLRLDRAPDHAAAERHLAELLADDPTDAAVWRGLERLYEAQARWSDLAALHERQLMDGPTVERRLALARLYEERLDDTGRALEHYRLALPHPEAAAGHERLLRLAEDWPALVAALRQRAEAEPTRAERARLLAEAARLTAAHLDRPGDAIGLWNQVIGLRGGDAEALDALIPLLEGEQRWRPLVETCEKRLRQLVPPADAASPARTGPGTSDRAARLGLAPTGPLPVVARAEPTADSARRALDLHLRIARVRAAHLGGDGALAHWQAALALDPNSEEALWGAHSDASCAPDLRADQAERLLDLIDIDDPRRADLLRELGRLYAGPLDDPDSAIEAWEAARAAAPDDPEPLLALLDLYDRNGDAEKLADALEAGPAKSPDAATRIAALLRIGELRELALDDRDGARAAYRAILAERPGHTDAFEALVRLVEDDAEQRVALLVARLDHERDPARRQGLLHDAALTAEARLSDPARALELRLRAFAEQPSAVGPDAKTERLAEITGAWHSLIEVCDGALNELGATRETVPLRVRVAGWCDARVNDTAGARVRYEAALAIDPDAPAAQAALQDLLERTGETTALIDALLHRAERAPKADRVPLLARAAALQTRADQPDAAADTWTQVLALDPTHAEALAALTWLHWEAERWPALADVLRRQLAVCDPAQRTALAARLAEIQRDKLRDLKAAAATWRDILAAEPDHLGALDGLAAAAADALDWTTWLDLRRRELAALTDPDRRHARRCEIAEVLDEMLGDADAAFDAWAEAYADRPDDETCRAAIERLAGETGRAVDAVALHTAALPRIRNAARARATQRLIAEHLGETPAAEAAWRALLETDPGDDRALAALDAIYTASQRWPELAEILARRADRARADVALAVRHAEVLDQHLGRADAARGAWRKVLSRDGQHAAAHRALFRLCTAPGDRAREAEWLVVHDASSPDHPEVLRALARLYQTDLRQPNKARETWSALVALRPRDAEALEALERLAEESGNAARLVEALVAKASADPSADTWARAARLYERTLAQAEEAATTWQRALDLDPTHAEALAALTRLHREAGRIQRLADVLSRRFDLALDGIAHQPTGAATTRSAGEVPFDDEAHAAARAVIDLGTELADLQAGHLGDPAAAIATLRRVRAAAPDHAPTLARLTDLLLGQRDHAAAAEVLADRAARTDDPLERAALDRQRGDLLESQVGDPAAAFAAYAAAYVEAPDDAALRAAVARLGEATGRHADLAATWAQAAEAAIAPAAELLHAAAAIHRDRLADPAGAAALYLRLLEEVDPRDLTAFDALEPLVEGHALADVLARRADAEPARAGELHARLARLQTELDLFDAALASWHRVLARDPRNLEALWGCYYLQHEGIDPEDRVETLSRLAGALPAEDPRRPGLMRDRARLLDDTLQRPDEARAAWAALLTAAPHDPEALERLEKAYRAREEWPALADVLTRRAEATPDSERRAEAFYQVGRLYEGALEDADQARKLYRRVLDLVPGHVAAGDRLEALLQQDADWDDLIGVLLRKLGTTEDPADRRAIYVQAAGMTERHLGSAAHAFLLLSRAYSERPTESLVPELERLAEAGNQWSELAAVYGRALADHSGSEAIRLHLRRATIFERLEQPGAAIEACRRALEIDHDHRDAHARLEALYRANGRWRDLLDLLDKRLRHTTRDRETQLALLREVIRVHTEHLARPEDALPAWREVLRLLPGDREALTALADAYRTKQRWAELAEVLQQQLEAGADAATTRRLRAELADLHRAHLQAPEQAAADLEAMLAQAPDDRETLARLADLYADLGRWKDAAEMLARLADVETDPPALRDLLLRLASIHREHLNDGGAAAAWLRRVLAVDPHHRPTLETLLKPAEAARDWPEVVRLLALIEASSADVAEKSRLLARIAKVYEDRIGELESATGYYEQALDIDPTNREVARRLADRYLHAEDWDLARPVLEKLVAAEMDTHRRCDDLVQLARCAQHLGDLDGARAAYDQAHALDSSHRGMLEGRQKLYFELEEYDAAYKSGQALLVHHKDRLAGHDKARILHRQAEIKERTEHLVQAIDLYRKALENEPERPATIQALSRLEQRISDAMHGRHPVADEARAVTPPPPRPDGQGARTAAGFWKDDSSEDPDVPAGAPVVIERKMPKWLVGTALGSFLIAATAVSMLWVQHTRLQESEQKYQSAERRMTKTMAAIAETQQQVAEKIRRIKKPGDVLEHDDHQVEMLARYRAGIEPDAKLPLDDQILDLHAQDLEMRHELKGLDGLFQDVLTQRDEAVTRQKALETKVAGLEQEMLALRAARSEVHERLATRLDANIEAVEQALSATGLDIKSLLDDRARIARADSAPSEEELGRIGGPFMEDRFEMGDPLEATPSVAGMLAPKTGYVNPIFGENEVMSRFGPRGNGHHNGIDIPAAVGTPVHAVAAGEVIYVQDMATWKARPKFVTVDGQEVKSAGWRAGVYVEIRHDDDRVSRYMHLGSISDGVEKGARVAAGQVIGTVGRTAVEESETHLHFELREPAVAEGGRYGEAIDPTPEVMNGADELLGGSLLDASLEDLKALDARERVVGGAGFEKEPLAAGVATKLDGRMDRLQELEGLLKRLPLVAPVEPYRVSSGFGRRRDPFTSEWGFHSGIDIPGEHQTPIRATAPGRVTMSGEHGRYGWMVEIDHGNGVVTRYGHLYKSLVRPGQVVRMREKVGLMGSSGRSTGTHLHYEVIVDGKPRDPMNFVQAGRYLSKR